MAINESYELKSQSEIVESYTSYFNNQSPISSYPLETLAVRKQIIEWVIFICRNLSFKPETLYRAISIFDLFISKNTTPVASINDVKLAAVASLNIATKMEELNCNFISFFTQNVLNEEGSECYSQKNLAEKEIEILKTLNFKTNKSNVFHFSSILLQLCFNSMENMQQFNWLITVNDQILKQIIKEDCSVYASPVQSALIAFNEALKQVFLTQLEAVTINNSIYYLMNRLSNKYNNNEECLNQRTFFYQSPVSKIKL